MEPAEQVSPLRDAVALLSSMFGFVTSCFSRLPSASGYREKIQFISSSINTKNSSIPTTMSLLPPPMATYPDLDTAFKDI